MFGDINERIEKRYVLLNFRVPKPWIEKLEKLPNKSEWLREIIKERLEDLENDGKS